MEATKTSKQKYAGEQTWSPKSRADAEFLRPSRLVAYLQVFGNLSVLIVLLILAKDAETWWFCLALFFGIGFAQHRLFFPIHDCLHITLFPTRSENRFFGAIIAGLLGTSFDAIRDQHMAHHRDFGLIEDPGAGDYFVRFRSRTEFLSFLAKPLFGVLLISKLREYVVRPAGPAERRSGSSSQWKPYLLILAIQGAVCGILTTGFALGELWRYPVFYVAPLVTVFLFLIRLRMFLEHGSLDYSVCDYFEGKRPTTRTIYASVLERIFLCGSNFNYHHEHHLYPSVPGCQLPRLHRKLLSTGYDPQDLRKSYTQSLLELWANLPWTGPKTEQV